MTSESRILGRDQELTIDHGEEAPPLNYLLRELTTALLLQQHIRYFNNILVYCTVDDVLSTVMLAATIANTHVDVNGKW